MKGLAMRRLLEVAGLMMVGEGVIGVLQPRGHVALWYRGPRSWRSMLRPFRDSPALTRGAALAEICIGLWLAARQQRPSLAQEGARRA